MLPLPLCLSASLQKRVPSHGTRVKVDTGASGVTGPHESEVIVKEAALKGLWCESVAGGSPFRFSLLEKETETCFNKISITNMYKGKRTRAKAGILVVESLLAFAEKWQKKTCR